MAERERAESFEVFKVPDSIRRPLKRLELPFPLMALFLYDLSTSPPAEATPVPLAKIDELWMRTSELAPLERLRVLRVAADRVAVGHDKERVAGIGADPAADVIREGTVGTTPFVLFAFTASELLLILLLLMVTAVVPPTAGCTTMPPPVEGASRSL